MANRRDYPRADGSHAVRFGVCGAHGREVPGFTNDLSLSGLSFSCPETNVKVGDHIAVEVTVAGYDDPLYFLGEVVRAVAGPSGVEVACRFDWLGKSDSYKQKLQALLDTFGQ